MKNMEENLLVNLFSFSDGIKGKVLFNYEWNSFKTKNIEIFVINESDKSIIIKNLQFKINNCNPHKPVFLEKFIEDTFILNSGNIYSKKKDLTCYGNNEYIRKIIDGSKEIPLYIKKINFNQCINNEEKANVNEYKVFEKKEEDNWIEK
jgi:hypothetical protein